MRNVLRRSFMLTAGGSVVATAIAGCGDDSDDTSQDASDATEATYEYIVIGSGAGGGPLASNLARAGHKVLLLEAGEDRGDSDVYKIPALHPQSTEDETMRWDYFVKHYSDDEQAVRDTKHTDEGILYPRAGTLGGCTAHNALITVYPHESDWNHVAEVTGDDTWRAANMRKYFEILEHCDYLGKNDDKRGHGTKGWLHTRQPDARVGLQDSKLLKIVTATATEVDRIQGGGFLGTLSESILHNELLSLMRRDLNTAAAGRDQLEGLFTVPIHANGGTRNGPREYILDTVAAGYPLTVKTGAYVTRILFGEGENKTRAVGVEYLQGKHLYRADPKAGSAGKGERKTINASREVILSCGAFNTPQLLKLSGIGPREELEDLDIDVLVDLPGVGENLQDRYEVGVVSELSGDFAALDGCTAGQPGDPCIARWKQGKGSYGNNGAVVAFVKKSSAAQKDPDLIIFGLPANFRGYVPGYSQEISKDHHHFTWAILKAHTENSAGYVRLRSADPLDVPEINFKYFQEGTPSAADLDLDAVATGVDLVRRINERIDGLFWFSSYDEVWPGPETRTQDDVRTWIKDEAWGHHASCTCKIGADDDPMAVLDSKFRVRGTEGLRVVDASVFPKIPGFFIVVPVYMIAEKATDEVLAAIGEKRPS